MKIKLARLRDKRTSDVLDFPLVENLGLGYLCSSLRTKGHDVEILDEEIQNISREEIVNRLKNVELIGFTATARPQIQGVLEVSEELKSQGYTGHITVGGHFPTFMYEELLKFYPCLDSVVLYEGEETLEELAGAIERGRTINEIQGIAFRENGQIVKNPLRPLIHNLNDLPFPAKDLEELILSRGGLSVISSSRGCYNRCSYCTISSFYRDPPGQSFRLRSAENVTKELKELKRRFPELRDLWFVDDNFVQKGEKGLERTRKICETLKSLGLKFDIYLRADDVNEQVIDLMKESGLRSVFIGAEAGTDKTLQEIFKKRTSVEQTRQAIRLCREYGINVDPGFIMFHPWSTMQEIGENIRFLEDIEECTPYGIASFLTAYKFTPIGREMSSGKRQYKTSGLNIDDPLQDDIPYEIEDSRAELLLDLTLKAFQGFKEVPRALRRSKSRARTENNDKLFAIHARNVREFSKTSMCYFKELYKFLNRQNLSGIKDFYERIATEIEDYSTKKVNEIGGKDAT